MHVYSCRHKLFLKIFLLVIEDTCACLPLDILIQLVPYHKQTLEEDFPLGFSRDLLEEGEFCWRQCF